jgi:hypothetical protein
MTGIIVSTPPTTSLPPSNASNNPVGLPGVTYQYALLNLPQSWGAKQTFPLGDISLHAADILDLAPSSTIDTTNASNIISGTLGAARLPNPTATTLGGIESLAAAGSKWINTISTSGVPSATQPAFTDISGTATIAQGGTGQGTAPAAFDTLAPTTTRGDIIARGASSNARLALGTSGYALLSNGTDAAWMGFLQSGTGAVARTWNAKATDVFSVADFGALGTADDSNFFLNAIAAAAVAGGTVLVPPGVFAVHNIVIPSGVVLRGAGRNATYLQSWHTEELPRALLNFMKRSLP